MPRVRVVVTPESHLIGNSIKLTALNFRFHAAASFLGQNLALNATHLSRLPSIIVHHSTEATPFLTKVRAIPRSKATKYGIYFTKIQMKDTILCSNRKEKKEKI